jgi:hypothetical protein
LEAASDFYVAKLPKGLMPFSLVALVGRPLYSTAFLPKACAKTVAMFSVASLKNTHKERRCDSRLKTSSETQTSRMKRKSSKLGAAFSEASC